MEKEQQQKCCLIEEHEDDCLYMFCVDKDCKHKSRSICFTCTLEKENNHEKCNNFIRFKGQNSSELKFQNKSIYNIQSLYDQIEEYEEKMCLEIEKEYDNLTKTIIEEINQLKKERKIEILSLYHDLKQKIGNQLKKQKVFQDLDLLQEEASKFLERKINIQELNDRLIEKQQQNTEKQTLKNMIDDKSQIEEYNLDNSVMESLKKQILKKLKEQHILKKKKEDNPILNQNILKLKPKFTCLEVQYNQWGQAQDCGVYPFGELYYQNGVYFTNSYTVLRSRDSFSRYDSIQLKMEILIKQKNRFQNINYNFRFGIIQSNISNIREQDISNFQFNDGVQACINQSFKNRQVFSIDICVEKNQFSVQSEDNTILFQNKKFLEDHERWIIIIGIYQNLEFKIL